MSVLLTSKLFHALFWSFHCYFDLIQVNVGMKVTSETVMAFLETLQSSLKKIENVFKFPDGKEHVRRTKTLQSC